MLALPCAVVMGPGGRGGGADGRFRKQLISININSQARCQDNPSRFIQSIHRHTHHITTAHGSASNGVSSTPPCPPCRGHHQPLYFPIRSTLVSELRLTHGEVEPVLEQARRAAGPRVPDPADDRGPRRIRHDGQLAPTAVTAASDQRMPHPHPLSTPPRGGGGRGRGRRRSRREAREGDGGYMRSGGRGHSEAEANVPLQMCRR